MTNTARPRQIDFLRDLLTDRQPAQLPLLDRLLDDGRLTFELASAKIDFLKSLPRPATEKQTEFVIDLLSSRRHDLDADAELAGLTFAHARELIDLLKPAPKIDRLGAHGIPAGYYVVPDPDETGHMLFRRVDTKGRLWIIAGPNQLPSRGADKAVELIKADPQFAAAHYGQIIGRCGRCHLRLTDDESRSIGLGPICRGKSW